MAATPVTTTRSNERPSMDIGQNNCLFIVTRRLNESSGVYTINVYKSCPNTGFSTILSMQQELYIDTEDLYL